VLKQSQCAHAITHKSQSRSSATCHLIIRITPLTYTDVLQAEGSSSPSTTTSKPAPALQQQTAATAAVAASQAAAGGSASSTLAAAAAANAAAVVTATAAVGAARAHVVQTEGFRYFEREYTAVRPVDIYTHCTLVLKHALDCTYAGCNCIAMVVIVYQSFYDYCRTVVLQLGTPRYLVY
jgi:hypothetical protein